MVVVISFIAGVLGSLLGLGGGMIVVPALTLLLGIDIRLAIGASIISVIATSSGAAAAYVKENLANLRVAMFLEIGTTLGAISGAYLAGIVHTRFLFILFGLLLAWSAFAMLQKRPAAHGAAYASPLADRLRLHSSYFDEAIGQAVDYRVTRPLTGLGLMYLAGAASGLLGIGSGALKVPAMDLAMRLPMKVSTATSNFMIGVTAAASAGLYFVRGDIDPVLAAPVAAGVLFGATIGSRFLGRLESRVIRAVFVVVLVVVSVQMLVRGVVL
ncbi:MAG TPA: sulfite exporter TauE/SafE family protein [Thermoanaerobaculia bacterium]